MDIDRDVIGVMLDRDGKPYLKLGQVSTCKRIHGEALKPLRGGGDCGKSISVWENFDGLLVCGEWTISSNSLNVNRYTRMVLNDIHAAVQRFIFHGS
jgi:hypothetical protein